jgi:TolB-like protein/DNA-binding winged helix-turn-helix (wHTH) protein/Tfp pilus assembly protein PilF
VTLTPAKDLVRFGPFELDPSIWQLRKNGIRVRLPQQPLQLLAVLLEHPGQVVTREELQGRLWSSEVFVDFEHGLNKNIQKLREALADSADSPRYIETIPRIGYRFIGPVADPPQPLVEEPKAKASESTALPVAVPAERKSIWRRKVLWAFILGCLATVVSAAVWLVHQRSQTAPIRSLAVLPLENLSGDPSQEYFAEGMTDELITELASIPNLRVVSRTSVMQEKGIRKPLRQIARDLDVDAVVEGSVVRLGDRVRITAQLIDVREDKHLWAESFEDRATDILSLQDNVARKIAAEAKIALAPKPASAARPIDPGAQDAYLRGLYFLDRRDPVKSTTYFQQAISIEPVYAAAYAGLAEALITKGLMEMAPTDDVIPQAITAAKRAIEIDPASSEAYTALGTIETFYGHDWSAAEQDLLRGIALGPNSSLAEAHYAIYLDAMNRPEEAVTRMRRALKLDPLSFITNRLLGSALYFARHYDEALHYLQQAAELEPDRADLAQNWMSLVYEKKGMLPEAMEADLFDMAEPYATTMRAAYRSGGWTAYQRARISVLSTHQPKGCFAYEIGLSYLRIGDRDAAIPWLNRGIDQDCFWRQWLQVNPVLDDFRSDPRYRDLLRRAKVPD